MDHDVVMVHGLSLPGGLGITEEKVEALTRLPVRKDDIFIVSYPISGSRSLFNVIVANLLNHPVDK